MVRDAAARAEAGRAGTAVALAFAVVGAAAVGFLAGRSIPREAGPPAAPRPEPISVVMPASPSAPAAPALAALGDGRLVYADPAGRIFVLETQRGITLTAAYAVREDRRRHLDDPESRAASGFYLDDLGVDGERAIARAREEFEREVGARALDAGANDRAEARARAILDAGDATYLLAKLADRRAITRRAAGLALGEAGFVAAAPALAEVMAAEAGERGAARARGLLEHLAGEPIANRAAFEAWWAARTPAERAARR
jgi:hypothetical protein